MVLLDPIIAWLVVIYFINLGLKQVDDAKDLELKKKDTIQDRDIKEL